MSQISICSFINIYNIFNFENIDGIYYIKSYIKKTNNQIEVKRINRPRLITFTKDCNIKLESIYENEFEIQDSRYMAILKSNLQKAIRRNLPNTAITTAIKLMQIKGGNILLLRRLCIIIVEDKLKDFDKVIENYKVLVWIMSTELGPNKWKNRILGFIRTICSFEHMYLKHNTNISNWYTNPHSNYLLIRSYFGGMKGDIRLLENIAKMIDENLDNYNKKQIIIEPIQNIEIIEDINILKSAIDFHCMPNMLNNIHEKNPEYNIDEIKEAIWIYSSSIRYKIPRKNENVIWKKIKLDVRKYQKFIIENI